MPQSIRESGRDDIRPDPPALRRSALATLVSSLNAFVGGHVALTLVVGPLLTQPAFVPLAVCSGLAGFLGMYLLARRISSLKSRSQGDALDQSGKNYDNWLIAATMTLPYFVAESIYGALRFPWAPMQSKDAPLVIVGAFVGMPFVLLGMNVVQAAIAMFLDARAAATYEERFHS